MVNKCRSLRTSEPVRSFCHSGGCDRPREGSTVTLYCGITPAGLAGAFDSIEITYEGGAGIVLGGGNAPPVTPPLPQFTGSVSAELIEMPKQTGAEAPTKCGIQPKGSATIATARQICENSNVDFNKYFCYLRTS
jgi:hypothetical protein